MDPKSFHLYLRESVNVTESSLKNDISKQFFMISENRNMFIIGVNKCYIMIYDISYREPRVSLCTIQLGLQTILQMIPLLDLIIVPSLRLRLQPTTISHLSAWFGRLDILAREMGNSMYNIIVFRLLTSFRILNSMI